MNWIKELKVGDQFLCGSENFIGTVTKKTRDKLYWNWYRISGEFHTKVDITFDTLLTIQVNWKPYTPLIKELL